MNITLPFTDEIINQLKCGDRVLLSGTVYTARDAAHKRMTEKLAAGSRSPLIFWGKRFITPVRARQSPVTQLVPAALRPAGGWTHILLPCSTLA